MAAALPVTQALNSVFPTPLFFAAIVVSTWFGGAASGLLAVALATLVLDYYFVPPIHRFALKSGDLPYLIQFAIPALLTCALFMGAAMSITAFPVLARILTERDLLRSRMGTLAIACAAVDDATGWCILAYIILLIRTTHGGRPIWVTLGGLILYVFLMLFGIRRLLTRFENSFRNRGRLTENAMACMVLLVLASALTTEALGIHLLFGAFSHGRHHAQEPGLHPVCPAQI